MIEIKPTKPVKYEDLLDIMKKCRERPAPTWRPPVKVEPCAMDMILLKPQPLVKKAPVAPVEKPQSTERPPAIVCWVSNTNPVSMWVGRHTGKGQYAMTKYAHGPVVTRAEGRTGDLKSLYSKHGCDIEQIRLTEKSSMTLAFWAGDPNDPDAMKKKLDVAVAETSEKLGLNGDRPAKVATDRGNGAIAERTAPKKPVKSGPCAGCYKPLGVGRNGDFCYRCAKLEHSEYGAY